MLLEPPLCDFGWQAPSFTLPDYDGATHTLDFGESGALVAFICNHCPYVQAIGSRLASDASVLQERGVSVFAIMSNDYVDYPADSPDRMKEFSAEYGFSFPYLVDGDQSVGRAYGAVCTPDFFGFNRSGELQYRGRLDDAGRGSGEGRTCELLEAMSQIAETGQGPREQHPSIGCSIKWKG